MSFVGLHIHSDYSLLDGASQLPDLVARAVELNMPAIALTDHGVMYGAIGLVKACQKQGIKPIIGNEMYVINGDITKQERRPRYHQVVLAKNQQGYRNLVKLTTISSLQGVQGRGIFARPCINKDLLAQHHEGLIVTSACLGGEVPQAIMQEKPEIARRIAQWYKDLFGEDYYLEIQDHGSQEDRVVNVELVRIAQELDIKIIATNDSHFISCYDVEAHDALLCIQTGKLIAEDKRLRYSGTEYLKTAEEMALLFRDHLQEEVIADAIATTLEVATKIETYDIFREPQSPDYEVPAGYTAETYLEEVTWKGLLERCDCPTRSQVTDVYKDRLEYELQMLQQMGFSTYFLVVWDYIKYARDHHIPVGPGRGSAAGSLVAYALGITNIDPVHHGLLFERFLNPERKSMPDIDTDFCIEKRDEMIDYVTRKYGEDRVAQIITFNRMTSKAVLKDVARVLDIPYGEADRMAKLIPVARGKPTKLKVMISEATPAPEFKEKYDNDPQVRRWLDMAIRIEGTNKTFGVHAAGVVIASEPLDQIVPLQRNNDGAVITQYFMEDLESLGLLKMDFLGLKNLTMIQKTTDLLQQNRQLDLDVDRVPMDDPEAFKLLARGELEGIFQLESSGMRQVVKDLKPSNLEDISSILALYRPGPLDAGLIPKFINRKHGRESIDYPHELIKPILEETYGIMVYQEQIMKIAQDMAGYSLGEADLLRRAMGKKKMSEMEKHREIFIEGAAQNGVDKKVAENLFEQMVLFAEYCLSYDTPVLTLEYGWLPMGQLVEAQIDCQVFSVNAHGYLYTQPIAQWHHRGQQEVFEYTLEDGSTIQATPEHQFMTVESHMRPIQQVFAEGLSLKQLNVIESKTPKRVQSLMQQDCEC
ncbi:MAG: DNA polymerase III subunit alpha [Acaryochloris sp. SU_5_25]|nr:DNA polymerase III subunit alpha [Acaryochloris sp. SU_5_25]